MTRINNSVELLKYVKQCAADMNNWDGTSLSVRLAFGARRQNDPSRDSGHFKRDYKDFTDEELALSQVLKDEPREKYNGKEASRLSKDKPRKVGAWLDRLYTDDESPIFHGFLNEMRSIMSNTLLFDKESYDELVDGLNFPPTSADRQWEKLLSVVNSSKQLEGLLPNKDKYPPAPGGACPPSLNEWKRTDLGNEHRTSIAARSNNSTTSGRLLDIFGHSSIMKHPAKHDPIVGMVEIDTGAAIFKVNYDEDAHDEEGANGADVSLNISLLDLVGKARSWTRYDKDSQERMFTVQTGEGKNFTTYTKAELSNVSLGKLLKIMRFPQGEVLRIIAGVRDVVESDDYVSLSM